MIELPFLIDILSNIEISFHLSLNTCLLQVPTSLCSVECPAGFAKEQNGIHKCCFNCVICPNGTYVNTTGKLLFT